MVPRKIVHLEAYVESRTSFLVEETLICVVIDPVPYHMFQRLTFIKNGLFCAD